MKSVLLLSIFYLGTLVSFAQVGINTTTPKATLDVVGNPSKSDETDGFIPPRISRAALSNKTGYNADQIATLIYVTDLSGSVTTATANITSIGYYYFNGSVWSAINNKANNNYGDVKQGFQTADHNGWVKLDGRLTSTLTTTQRVQTTALGFATSIPDATGNVLMQNGTTLGTVSGTNSKTISRANLPNENITTTTNGNHSHTYNDKGQGGVGFYLERNSNMAAEYNNESTRTTSTSGNHNHTIALNGGVTQTALDVTPKSLSINTFIYLGN